MSTTTSTSTTTWGSAPCLPARRSAGGDRAVVSDGAFARSVETPATQEDERLMREAIAEAKLGDYPFGAVIVRDGKVLAKGRNLGKLEDDPTAHGEMLAIRQF